MAAVMIMTSIELFLALLAYLLLLLIWQWQQSRNLPIMNWPLLGMSPRLLCNAHRIHEFATQCLKQCSTFEFRGPWFANSDFLVTTDPDNVHHMLSKHFSNFRKGSNFKNVFGDFLGDGIFISESESSWATLRRSTHSLLKNGRFQQLFEKTIQDKVQKGLIPILDHVSVMGMEVDLQELFARFTFDNICMFVLGVDPGLLSIEFHDESYVTAFDDAEEAILYRYILPESYWRLQRWLQIGKERKLSKGIKALEQFVFQSISSKRETLLRRSKEGSCFDFLTAYLENDDDKLNLTTAGIEVSDKFLRDTTINLLVAGKDTITAALSWFFWLIATHPFVENKIWEEIKANINIRDDQKDDHYKVKAWWIFSAEEVRNKFVYLHGALCETLRLFPSVPVEHKSPIKADTLPSGHKIDADTQVLFSLYAMGRMENIWGSDCLEFKPERWINSERGGIVHVPSYKFIAFNAGPRTCLGKEMSFIQLKIVAIAIICNYHIQLVEGHPVCPSSSVILHMRHGLKVKVSKRCV